MNLASASLLSSAIVVASFVSISVRPPTNGLEVKDSKGRVRIASFEDGDSFGLALSDHLGVRRLTLHCGADGAALVSFHDGGGIEAMRSGFNADRSVGLVCCAPGGVPISIMSDPLDWAAIGVGLPKDGRSAFLAVEKPGGKVGLTLVRREGESESRILMSAMPALRSGLHVERDGKKMVGLVADQDKGMMWIGEDAINSSAEGFGARLSWDPDVGAELTMRHSAKSNHVIVQDNEKKGSGFQVGRSEGGFCRVGVSAEGAPRLRLTSPGGESIVELPKK